jgi:hypothetical protein
MPQRFDSFASFYPFYLSQHENRWCRRLHFVGSSIGLGCAALALTRRQPSLIAAGLLAGYGLAWVGHFGFEKNRPATFQHPVYSFIGDWAMWRDIATGKIEF